jgi:hypothetical protein
MCMHGGVHRNQHVNRLRSAPISGSWLTSLRTRLLHNACSLPGSKATEIGTRSCSRRSSATLVPLHASSGTASKAPHLVQYWY